MIGTILSLLVFQAPLIVIACVGLWFSVSRRTHLVHASKYAARGFSLLIAYSLASVTVSVLNLLAQVAARTESASIVGETVWMLKVAGLGAYSLLIAAVALIARAVFLDRNIGESD